MAKRKGSSRRSKSAAVGSGAGTTTNEVSKTSRVDLAVEYAYVAQDLGRIGIIAAVLIALLIGLSFFL